MGQPDPLGQPHLQERVRWVVAPGSLGQADLQERFRWVVAAKVRGRRTSRSVSVGGGAQSEGQADLQERFRWRFRVLNNV